MLWSGLCRIQDGEEEDGSGKRASGGAPATTAAAEASVRQQQATLKAIEQARAIAASLSKLQQQPAAVTLL